MTQRTSLQWPVPRPGLSLNVLPSLHLRPIPLPSFVTCPCPQCTPLFTQWHILLPSLALLSPSIVPSLEPSLPSTAALGTPLPFRCWANTWLHLVVPLPMRLLLVVSRRVYFTQRRTFHGQPTYVFYIFLDSCHFVPFIKLPPSSQGYYCAYIQYNSAMNLFILLHSILCI